MTTQPRLEWATLLGGAYFYVPYHAGFVAGIKDRVPPAERQWEGKPHYRWYVADAYVQEVITLAVLYFGHIEQPRKPDGTRTGGRNWKSEYEGNFSHSTGPTYKGRDYGFDPNEYDYIPGWGWRKKTASHDPRQHAPPAHYQKLFVTFEAPPEVIKAAYKALAKLYHPDNNQRDHQDGKAMQELNTAYEAIKKERKL